MTTNLTGEAFTREKCALCGDRHPVMDARAMTIFGELGFTPEEIAAIGAEQAEAAASPFGQEVPEEPHIKPSDAAESTRERKRRSRALRRGDVTP